MMPRALLHSLKASGIVLRAEGDRLKWRALEGCMAPKMLERIKANKAGLLALLHANQADTYNKDSETAIGETQPIALLTQGSYKTPLLLPEHLSDGWPYRNKIILGDCLEKLKLIPDDSIDEIVTDPPYGIEFMGKDWDRAIPGVEIWKECHRVLKPGAFAFVMCIPRQDCLPRMILNLEAAGFKIDFTSLYWTYASGFTKAHNISKAIDKKLGAERKIIGRNPNSRENCDKSNTIYESGTVGKTAHITETATPKAKELDGAYAGFQPKPAVEIIIVAMKPIDENTYTDQALSNGKGVTWLDDCRIPYKNENEHVLKYPKYLDGSYKSDNSKALFYGDQININKDGRFPANLLVSDDVLDDGKNRPGGYFPAKRGKTEYFGLNEKGSETVGKINDGGGYSRYFSLDAWWNKCSERFPENIRKSLPFLIAPKASRKEKEAGLESLVEQSLKGRDPGQDKRNVAFKSRPTPRRNTHPTVKPIELMAYLITMGSREGDVVLDPFCGTATTCIAAKLLKRQHIGIEINPEYHAIAVSRMEGFDQIKSGKILKLAERLLENETGEKKAISNEDNPASFPSLKKKPGNSRFINKVIQGDCFKLIEALEDNSIDLVITSPPYADVVNYGKGVDIYHPDNYVVWILPLFNEIHRILKPSGSFILNINDRIVKKQRHTYVFELVYRAVKESNLKLYDRYFWVKKNAQPNCNSKRLSNSTEYLFHFCKNVDLIKWNMDAVREPYNENTLIRGQYPVASTQFKVDESGIPLARSKRMRKAHEKGKIPSNVFQFPTAASIKDKKHPAVFHIDLPTWFIKALTDEGDLILDPMCGTATTCAAAKQLSRDYIGIEINSTYHKMAVERINSVNLTDNEPEHPVQFDKKNGKTEKYSRIVKRGEGDFPKTYRPSRISEVYGQGNISKIIGKGLDDGSLAHCFLFYGPSGTGKTTLARIIGMGLLCEKGPTSEPCCECGSCIRVAKGYHLDFFDINCADLTGIDHIRKLKEQFDTAAFGKAKYKIFVFEECHQLSKESQNMLLKLVEDSHGQNYFVFCSTEPDRIIKTLRNRCLPIEFQKIQPEEIRRLIQDVCECEGFNCPEEIMESIIQESEGMARNALFSLQKAVSIGW